MLGRPAPDRAGSHADEFLERAIERRLGLVAQLFRKYSLLNQ